MRDRLQLTDPYHRGHRKSRGLRGNIILVQIIILPQSVSVCSEREINSNLLLQSRFIVELKDTDMLWIAVIVHLVKISFLIDPSLWIFGQGAVCYSVLSHPPMTSLLSIRSQGTWLLCRTGAAIKTHFRHLGSLPAWQHPSPHLHGSLPKYGCRTPWVWDIGKQHSQSSIIFQYD